MLRIVDHPVDQVVEGPLAYDGGVLQLDLDNLREEVLSDARIKDAHMNLVRPGDPVRVGNVLDVTDARRRVGGPTYPGVDGPVASAHDDVEIHRFEDFQIVEAGIPPTGEGGLMVARRAFIDYWGEGARWTPFADTPTLVADLVFDDEIIDKVAVDSAARTALLTLSSTIGTLGCQSTGARNREFGALWERTQADGLPRVAYVYQVQSQGALVDTFLYGSPLRGLYPTLIDPIELLSGALVSGNHQRVTTPTIWHCNNPVVERLLDEDGKAIEFVGVVLMEGHHKTTPEKQRSADHAVQLLRYLRVDGAVLTQEGGGMSIVDQMLTVEGARKAGIECVALTYEMAGPEGTDRPLIHFTRAAKNLISTGNRDGVVHLEAPSRVLGNAGVTARTSRFGGATSSGAPMPGASTEVSESMDLAGTMNAPLWALYGSVSQVGGARARATSAA
jgi:glycine reductase